MLTVEEILEEYGRCIMDPIHAIESYLITFDKTQEGFVPFKLMDKQKEIVNGYINYRFNMVTKPRQAGVSTTTAAYAAIVAAFADEKNPEAILILANKQDMAFEFLGKIKDFLSQLPRWVWGHEYYGSPDKEAKSIFLTDSKKELKLPNGSRLKAVATSKDALRGYTPTWLIMDEAAFIDNGVEVFGAALTALGTGGRAALVSTPNGMDKLYYKTYEQSKSGDNDFHIIEMKWYQDKRYNYDLVWTHEDDDTNIVTEVEFTHSHYEQMILDGYKPSSTWYRAMCRGMNNNARMIAQELDVSFIGSGGNVIDEKYVAYHERVNVKAPKYTSGDEGEIWIWSEPIEGHEYILSADVARGDGEDSSTIVVVDFTTMEQVMEYKGKLQPDLLAYVVDEYARIYDAMAVVDITGGMGVGTINKLLELGTPNIYYGETSNKPLEKLTNRIENYTNEGKYPGFNVGPGVRTPMVSHLEYMVRTNAIVIRSRRLTSEMKTFVFKNGRADHKEGYHDDLIMAMAMALWVVETSFKKLKASTQKTKAMLGAWVMSGGDSKIQGDQRENFVAKSDKGVKSIGKPNFSNKTSRNMQDPTGKYMWLFSGSK
jgi:hypothetical protein